MEVMVVSVIGQDLSISTEDWLSVEGQVDVNIYGSPIRSNSGAPSTAEIATGKWSDHIVSININNLKVLQYVQ